MEFEVYGLGIVCASVCTSLTAEEAELALNVEAPTGISSRWTLSGDKTFLTGGPRPCQVPGPPRQPALPVQLLTGGLPLARGA